MILCIENYYNNDLSLENHEISVIIQYTIQNIATLHMYCKSKWETLIIIRIAEIGFWDNAFKSTVKIVHKKLTIQYFINQRIPILILAWFYL